MIALCAIGRMENRYAREWVDYHLAAGFGHIYICDNNRVGEERFEEVLGEPIREGRVTLLDYRNRERAQIQAYNNTYRQYGVHYEWTAFLDFDEFLVTDRPLREWLGDFRQTDCVLVNWRVMTDSGHLRYEPRSVRERFTMSLGNDVLMRGEHRYNDHVKSIVRGNRPTMRFRKNPHVPMGLSIYRNASRRLVEPSPFQPCNHRRARIDHYLTKTLDEWLTVKYARGYPCGITQEWRETMAIPQFFEINERTSEKEAILQEWLALAERGVTT